jgi:SAM-dependent methyltransferase
MKHHTSLQRILAAPHPPKPWVDGYQIPWNDPAFSERMLHVHLDPSTHMASRNSGMIDRHVEWLLSQIPAGSHVLDVGCGPGLYCHELARRGHRATGFDFAPAPLDWARTKAEAEKLDCRFHNFDLTALPEDFTAQVGGKVDVITFWFGEFHSFSPEMVRDFLPRLKHCLRPGGLFILEYQPAEIFVKEESTDWSCVESSIFCDQPHLWLQEFGWDEETDTEVHVHWILESESGNLQRYIQCHKAWTDAQLIALLAEAGFSEPVFHPAITGESEEFEFPLVVIRA